MNRLPEILLKNREALKMTQGDVARAIGKGLRTYQYYEDGETMPRQDTLTKLSEVLKFDLKDIYEGAGKLHKEPAKQTNEHEPDYQAQRREQKLNGNNNNKIPVYEEAPFTLSNIETYRDSRTDNPDFWITIPGLRKCNYGCRAIGDSMHPYIRSHALVVGEEITDFTFLLYGEVYIVIAKNGIETVKYIHPHESDPDYVVLVPFNKEAQRTPLRKDEILKLYRARAVFNIL